MYFCRYFCIVIFGFLLSLCTNYNSFVFNHLSISSFVGFHGLNTPLYFFIFYANISWIPLTQSHVVLADKKTICWLILSFYHYWVDLSPNLLCFPTKPYKNITPCGKPEGNIVHWVQCAVSPEIVL
jgi:hypothetical protein